MIRPVRVLFVNGTSEIGGADTDLLEICRHLDRSRYKVTAVLPHPGPLSDDFEAAGARLVYLNPAPIKRFHRLGQFLAYPFHFIRAMLSLASLIRKERVALVHINTAVLPAAGLAAKLAGVPCVWHVREIELLQRSRLVGAVLRGCIRACADQVIAISQAVAGGLRAAIQSKTTVIYHGVDIGRFCRRESVLRAELSLPSSAKVIGYIGRLSPIKGLDYLIAALPLIHQHLPETHLVLAGPVLGYGEHVADLQRQVEKLELSDRVLFLSNHTDPPDVICAFDLLVLPTVVPEGLGLVILEGLASGKPVIATNCGGPVEILTGCAAGRLVPPRDARAIAEAAVELLSLPTEQRQALSLQARQWAVERFSVQRMIGELMDVYECVLGREKSCEGEKV